MVESTPFSIRQALLAEGVGIVRCLQAAFEDYRISYTPPAFLDTVLTPQTVQRRLREMAVFVAVDKKDRVVGTIACKVLGSGEGYIRGMAVLPGWRGTCLATQLLKTVESHLRELKCTRVFLDTTAPLQRAIRFYERNGFRSSGRVSDFFGMPLLEYTKQL